MHVAQYYRCQLFRAARMYTVHCTGGNKLNQLWSARAGANRSSTTLLMLPNLLYTLNFTTRLLDV